MNSLWQSLEEFFDVAWERLSRLSEYWRTHSNRRTILTSLFAGALAVVFYVSAVEPPDSFPLNTLVNVPEGSTLSETADAFKEHGIVRSALALTIVMTVTGHERDVHAGDYLFKEPKNLFSVARAIAVGAYGLEPARFRVPEGATTREMALIFGGQLERFDSERFLESAQLLEGYLYPDTYFFLPNTTESQVLSAMHQNFDARIKLLGKEIVAFGRPLEEVVIMASLLEREAENFEDRRKIAGVLWNRLDRDMLLQVDAAFLYTLGRSTFDLTSRDLKSDDPYNTYVNKGLPPGPIGSPSLSALRAAVTPVEHDYYFYLADHENVTHFSKTYEEHLEKKREYLGT